MTRRTERRDSDKGWSEVEYLGTEIDGLWTVYRKDGSKDWERQYCAGEQHGYERTWDTTGRLLDEKWFLNGKLHGTWRLWDANGLLRMEANFVGGEQEGDQSNWDEMGQLITQGTIVAGVREGTFLIEVQEEDSADSRLMIHEFRAGELVSERLHRVLNAGEIPI